VSEETDFGRLEEHERTTLAVGATGGTTNAVDVVARIIWGVELHDPVYVRDLVGFVRGLYREELVRTYIKASSSDVCANQRALLRVAELEEGVCSLLLLLFSVKIQDRKVNVIKEFSVVFDAIAA
jgi:hypothetical protein